MHRTKHKPNKEAAGGVRGRVTDTKTVAMQHNRTWAYNACKCGWGGMCVVVAHA
ncbi:TPA: hypothetical protein IBL10_004970 [Escherichia coli]|nr:hypothetical protein [Escherichia coli]